MSADVVYIDTSAVVKLFVQEPESAALRKKLAQCPTRASSALLRVELLRATRRAGLPAATTAARRYVNDIFLIRLNDTLLERAATLEPTTLRSLDAIHLATALSLGNDLAEVITYDERMAEGASALGLRVSSPH